MNDKRYKWILYTIVAVIITTIGIQIYWNYKNYQTNKQQLINDVQVSLDKAVDDYYTNLAEQTTLGLSISGERHEDVFNEGGLLEQLTQRIKIDESNQIISEIDIDPDSIKGVAIFRGFQTDSMIEQYRLGHRPISADSFSNEIKFLNKGKDSIKLPNFEMLTSKVVISINNDTLDIRKVDSLVKLELLRKNIDVDYKIHYTNPQDSIIKVKGLKEIIDNEAIGKGKILLSTFSKSAFLPENCQLGITFTNQTKLVLKRILGGILISTLLVLAVISCLFYLLKIIKHQKQLAEVKNDLISNITHEFKTPIATIGVALESINSFNVIEDKEKTKNYINMSTVQLNKLNVMVEKLLETATLDSDNLELNKERIDIIELISALISRYKIQFPEKNFNTNFEADTANVAVDIFHFENALNNILDNAVKYGGNSIFIEIIPKSQSLTILISDNGNTLTKANKERIFEKFYRVPKGNTHDVKGFGIGLFYTKTIIEKHNGSISLDLGNALTTFKITIPNA